MCSPFTKPDIQETFSSELQSDKLSPFNIQDNQPCWLAVFKLFLTVETNCFYNYCQIKFQRKHQKVVFKGLKLSFYSTFNFTQLFKWWIYHYIFLYFMTTYLIFKINDTQSRVCTMGQKKSTLILVWGFLSISFFQ